MTLLIILMLADAVLHAALVGRFGVKQNEPFLVFAIVYVVLAVLVFFAVPYALWIVLVLAAIGLVGFTVTFNKVPRDKTFEKVIWVLDLVIVLYTVYLLFAATGAAPPPAA